MAEILIKGMKMPKGCNECRFHDGSWCCIQPIENWRDSYYRPPEGEKQPTCPLIEVPPHGRLIDLDAFLESEKGKVTVVHRSVGTTICRNIYDRISNAQIVIEAST